nr:DUF4450 domain-containing protein [uncultured Carboxylicivirga sp.]
MRLLIFSLFVLNWLPSFAQMKRMAAYEEQRELRYTPQGDSFVIENGCIKFNKALYGTNTAFRVETSDIPELGLFMPNMGGNIQFGLMIGDKSKWLNDADYIKSTYQPGTRIYDIEDSIIGDGSILIKVLALADSDGVIVKFESSNIPKDAELIIMYGGASNKRFSRNGDLGVDKPDCFDLQPEACKGNMYTINKNRFDLDYGQKTKQPRSVQGIFSKGTKIKTGSPLVINSPLELWNSKALDDQPVLVARLGLNKKDAEYFIIKAKDESDLRDSDLAKLFQQADDKRLLIANTVQLNTPDEFINPIGGLLGTAADAIWDDCWMHGAIGWRMPLNGWRAAYTGDCIGWHQRAREHFNNYAASQVTDVKPTIAHPAQDTSRNFARAAKIWGTPMYSNGYICRNPNQNTKMHHYDMNLCYIDELLWHLNWTGDWDYAREVWPVIERHLKWEKRNFDPNDDGLYDAYASIWASDALYYNSGAVTHSSAYNYRANKMAAMIAEGIGVDPQLYIDEAEKIHSAIQSKLWLDHKGRWAEYVDFMGPGNVHPDAAIWTVYHALDSDVPDIFQAYEATRYIDTEIPHIPVVAKGLTGDGYQTISTTHWFPYSWSINNVAFAEVAHTALAYWQSGRNDEAFKLFKSSVLDGMYLGNSPGNIGQISFYDKARGECYRDFGDPVGMYCRTVIQGLFGIQPDLLNNRLVIQPGLPTDWEFAKIQTSDITFDFVKYEVSNTYQITNRLKEGVELSLRIKAEKSGVKEVLVNGEPHDWQLIESVGRPILQITCDDFTSAEIKVVWAGSYIIHANYNKSGVSGNRWQLTSNNEIIKIYDPQSILKGEKVDSHSVEAELQGECGHHTFFIQLQQDDMKWWEPVDIEIKEPFTIDYLSEDDQLKFRILNNQNEDFSGAIKINHSKVLSDKLIIKAGEFSQWISVSEADAVFGSNLLEVFNQDAIIYQTHLVNWNLQNADAVYEMIDLHSVFNASVSDIFKQEYLSPRSPYTTLQIPTQGIGEWCHPLQTATINDAGFRAKVKDVVFNTPFHIPFKSLSDTTKSNIAYTSLWDNYPNQIQIPIDGKARHAYLLMAGSTNHMQCHIPNGKVVVTYTDGSSDSLQLVNPDNWLPIEQDLYTDDYAFKLERSAPYRVAFKTGLVSRYLGADLNINPHEVYGREIDGGAGIIVDLPLNASKELKNIRVEAVANDVVIGLMSITLMK